MKGEGTSRGRRGVWTLLVVATLAAAIAGAGGTATPLPAFNAECVLAASSTDAIIRGRIFTYGLPLVSNWTLDYGTLPSYELGSVAGGMLPGDVLGANEVTAALSGLTAGQSYHYRFTAANANGTAHGADQTFTAGSAAANCGYGPPDATGLPPKLGPVSAVAIGTNVIVTANVFTHGTQTNWSIDYGLTSAYGTTDNVVTPVAADTSGSSAVTATITGLTASTPYDLKVTVSNGLGSDSSANVAVSTTTAEDLCLFKLCPVGGTASYDTTAGTLSTVIYTYGVPATTWSVEYGTLPSYGSTVSGGTATADANGPTPVSVSIPGLTPGTTYYYRIDATNTRGSTQGVGGTFVP